MQDRFKFRTWHKPTNTMEYNGLWTGRDWDKKFSDCNIVIMQCTGLKDKNGKLIYEGDRCRNSKSGEVFNVVWHNPLASFCWQKHEHSHIYSYGELFRAFDYYEVIGNIYENPELLEVSNDH